MTNFKVHFDGIFFDIERTREDVDDYAVFRTFREAKARVVKHMQDRADEYRESAKTARATRLSDISTEIDPDPYGEAREHIYGER